MAQLLISQSLNYIIMEDMPLAVTCKTTYLIPQKAHKIFSLSSGCWPPWLIWTCLRLKISRLRVQPLPSRQHSFVEIDHEIFSMVILSFPLIQEGQLSVSGERMCTLLVNSLED